VAVLVAVAVTTAVGVAAIGVDVAVGEATTGEATIVVEVAVGVVVDVAVTTAVAVTVLVISAETLNRWLPDRAAVAPCGAAPSPSSGAARAPPRIMATRVATLMMPQRRRRNDPMGLLPPGVSLSS
jgi:hypothetical protein